MFIHNPAEVAYFVAGAAHFSSSWPKVKQNCDFRFERDVRWNLSQFVFPISRKSTTHLIFEFLLLFRFNCGKWLPLKAVQQWNPVNFRWNACLQLSLSSLIQTMHASSAGWSAVRRRVTFPARRLGRSLMAANKIRWQPNNGRQTDDYLDCITMVPGSACLCYFFVVTRESSW